MKKILKLMTITIVVILSMCLLNVVEAASLSASASASSSTVNPGDTVKVTVNFGKSLGAATATINYDSSVFTLQGVSNGDRNGSKVVFYDAKAPISSMTFTFKANKVGSGSFSIALSGLANADASATYSGTTVKTGTVTVKEKQVEPTPDPTPDPAPEPTPDPTPAKSSNANLKNLGFNPNDFSGFRSGTTTYHVSVPYDTESINIYAYAQDDKASVTGTGTKNLKEGKNTFEVKVTAEDGTTKTYTLNVTRNVKEEDIPNNEEEKPEEEKKPEETTQLALASLEVSDVSINPEFSPEVHEYRALLSDLTVEKITVTAKANKEGATIEVTGNENLVEGDNTITILLRSGEESATYQIVVVKSTKAEENKIENTNTLTQTSATVTSGKTGFSFIKIIVIGIIGVIALAAVIALVVTKIKYRKDKNEGVDVNFIDDINTDDSNEEEIGEKKNKDGKGKHF